MDEDKLAMIEKIIQDINNVLSKSTELHAFEVIPIQIHLKNKSPVLFVEYCLGLESWCVKHVYMYCYNEIMQKHFFKHNRNNKNSKPTCDSLARLIQLLNITLLLNPDVSSFWNKRREMLLHCPLETASELNFAKLVLSRKPKCNDAYAYIRWILQTMFQEASIYKNLDNVIDEQLLICESASDTCPNNYHSWNHRMWLVNMIKSLSNYDIPSLYIKEYAFSEDWTSKHVSDYSGFHYRQFCMTNILTLDDANWKTFETNSDKNLRKSLANFYAMNFPKVTVQKFNENIELYSEANIVKLLFDNTKKTCVCLSDVTLCHRIEVFMYELVLNSELLRFYKYHETLWCHRRFIVHEIVVLMHDYFGCSCQKGVLANKRYNCLDESQRQTPKMVNCDNSGVDSQKQTSKMVDSDCSGDDSRRTPKMSLCHSSEEVSQRPKMTKYDNKLVYSSVMYKVLMSHEIKLINECRNDGDVFADRYEKYLKMNGFYHL